MDKVKAACKLRKDPARNHPDISLTLKRHVEILESLKKGYPDISDALKKKVSRHSGHPKKNHSNICKVLKGGSYEQS